MSLKLNDIIRFEDGRVGTICYRFLDGEGGVWGRHVFAMPEGGFGDELPAPEFILRRKDIEPLLRQRWELRNVECVGEMDWEFENADAGPWALKAKGVGDANVQEL